MASTYSTSLKLTLIGDGDQAGIWGQTTNTNLGTLLEQAIVGVQAITMSDANYTLTDFNGVTDEARNAVIVVTGTNNAVRDLIPPVVQKLYTIVNNTSGGYDIRIIGASGTGVNVPNGATCLVYCNGTNFYSGLSGTAGNFNVNGTLSATTVTATTGTFTSVSGNGASLTAINASNLSSGTVGTARLGTGTANASTYLAGNSTWVSLPPISSVVTANYSMFQDGTKLVFQYNGSNVASLDSTGVFTALNSVVSGGTP
jgi:hypothetical protein